MQKRRPSCFFSKMRRSLRSGPASGVRAHLRGVMPKRSAHFKVAVRCAPTEKASGGMPSMVRKSLWTMDAAGRVAPVSLHWEFGFEGPAALAGSGAEEVQEGLADGGLAGDVVLIELGEGAVVGLDELVSRLQAG